ncbi:MAG: hypothetical protein ABL907_10350 [Hyphomicrobium sp.]
MAQKKLSPVKIDAVDDREGIFVAFLAATLISAAALAAFVAYSAG